MCGKKCTTRELNYDSTRGYVHRDESEMYNRFEASSAPQYSRIVSR